MYLLDTQTGQSTLLSKHTGDVQYTPQYFSQDGKKLYYLTDEGSEFRYLASYDIATGARQKEEEALGYCVSVLVQKQEIPGGDHQ